MTQKPTHGTKKAPTGRTGTEKKEKVYKKDGVAYTNADVVERTLLTLDGCGWCDEWKEKYKKDIADGKIVVRDVDADSHGDDIARDLNIDEFPAMVVELRGKEKRYVKEK